MAHYSVFIFFLEIIQFIRPISQMIFLKSF